NEPRRREQVVEPLLPGEPSDRPDREVGRLETECRARRRCPSRRAIEVRRLDALPEDVELLARPEAALDVPFGRAGRDHDPGVERAPGETIEGAVRLELVRRTEEEDGAPATPRRPPDGRHA